MESNAMNDTTREDRLRRSIGRGDWGAIPEADPAMEDGARVVRLPRRWRYTSPPATRNARRFIYLVIDRFHAEADPALPVNLKYLDLDKLTFR